MPGKPVRIYLGDLDHFVVGNRISAPYGIAMIKSLAEAVFGRDVDISLFKHPQALAEAIRHAPPDILAMSYYMWNVNISLRIIQFCHAIHPTTLSVIGGPSVGRSSERYQSLLDENPALDIVVLDTGEKTFLHVLEAFMAHGPNRAAIFRQPIPGCATREGGDGNVTRGPIVDQYIDFSRIPSPYLTGMLDPFLEAGHLPQLETNRGCPYSCTFCDYGSEYRTKVNIRDESIIMEELRYMSRKSSSRELSITDANFGILGERDLRISEFMLDLYKSTGFPYISDWASSKAKNETSLKVMETVSKIVGGVYFGLQTLTSEALHNAKRKNIPFEQILQISRDRSVPVSVDLIFGLPGETKNSFMNTISQLIDLGVTSPSIYQLRILPGTEADVAERERYSYETRFRLFNNRFGSYSLEQDSPPVRVVESEEILVGNSYFSVNDFLETRKYGFFSELLLGYGNYPGVVSYLSARGVKVSELIQALQRGARERPLLTALLHNYDEYVSGELFDTEDALRERIAGNDDEWSNLTSMQGRFFKINLGFVGYCMFIEPDVFNEIDSLIREYSMTRLFDTDLDDLEEVLSRDRLTRIYADGERLSADARRHESCHITETINHLETFDYAGWSSSGFAGSLTEWRLERARKQFYTISEFPALIRHVHGLSDLEGYNLAERILLYAPRISLNRRVVAAA